MRILIIISLFCIAGCSPPVKDEAPSVFPFEIETEEVEYPAGKLFIIGGGVRTPDLMNSLFDAANNDSLASVAVLCLASAEPDTSFYYLQKDLVLAGFQNVWYFNPEISIDYRDSLLRADVIFISGGDQNRFMQMADSLSLIEVIHYVYEDGGIIAGTSAGAAVMSEVMISGDQYRESEYESTYSRIMTENARYESGLGILKNVIIDQHFVVRSRHNRLLTALFDYPEMLGVGIDESTAILVQDGFATVKGSAQVITFELFGHADADSTGLIRLENVNLNILTHEDFFELPY
jgi:cyanophycinase